ncbi:unnamed protein product [Adineta ricciae]|uniref:NHL repeat containing protein n=1 Tax=Adineta ricciae TaxID=249248 RepID=A0A816DUI0_ADIRI|nr:unnamed protein product [Adineta ricciae]CAF1638505.1 unnamed protein product [Adineta ricciae]
MILTSLSIFSIGTSVNRPKLCPSATWNTTATTFADMNAVGIYPRGIFINKNNMICVINQQLQSIQIWTNGSSTPILIAVRNNSYPMSLFAADDDTIYVDDGSAYVSVWQLNQPGHRPSLYTGDRCYGLFIDTKNSLYCSLYNRHVVIKRSLNSSDVQMTVVAGESCYGFLGNKLYFPMGIFVDGNYNLYVADYANHRIQFFGSGQSNATTAAGSGAPGTIALYYPTDVMADADGYIYILDHNDYRIIGSTSYGFRCVAGCTGSSGSAADQLADSWNIAFDVYGNIFIADSGNNRVQKFLLATNSCDATTTSQQTSTPSVNAGISYNQPKLYGNASWNENATTFADASTIGKQTMNVFVDANNTVYVINRDSIHIQVWAGGKLSISKNIAVGNALPTSLFVTDVGGIYIDAGDIVGQVSQWSLNTLSSTPLMYVGHSCYDIVVDLNNTIYCALSNNHQIIAKSLYEFSNTVTLVAGTGCSGQASDMLGYPQGIFVTVNFDLYVADTGNSRVQLFLSGQKKGVTMAGNGAPKTISLKCPTDVMLDADDNLFILDACDNRIVGSGPNGFQCIVGCSNSGGSAANQILKSQSMAFDSYGNIYVADYGNSRIQLFTLSNSLWGKS